MYQFAGATASQLDQTRGVLTGDSFASHFNRYCRTCLLNGGLDPVRFSLSVVSRWRDLLGLVNDTAPWISDAHATWW